jgi:hypothetical protein
MPLVDVYSGREKPLTEFEKEKPGSVELLSKKLQEDLKWENIRQYIKKLPRKKQIKLNGEILKNSLFYRKERN